MNIDPIRVLIVDDHAVVRAGYRAFLQGEPGFTVVAEAASSDEAYEKFKRTLPDVVIMDIMLNGPSGIDASRRILEYSRDSRILVFSMYTESAFIHQALEIGVLGVVGKDSPPDRLLEAAMAVAQGRMYLSPEIAQRMALSQFNRARKTIETLSPREFEIFQLLVSGVTNDHIAQALNLSAKTVANRLSNIRDKLSVHSDIQLMRLAADAGMVSWMTAGLPRASRAPAPALVGRTSQDSS